MTLRQREYYDVLEGEKLLGTVWRYSDASGKWSSTAMDDMRNVYYIGDYDDRQEAVEHILEFHHIEKGSECPTSTKSS